MEKIKIEIEHLGSIRDSEIELSPVMIFSGESGLGKSYLAILCHYFFDVLVNNARINGFIKEQGLNFSRMRQSLNGIGEAFYLSKKDLESWLSKDAVQYLRYMLNNDTMSASVHVSLPSAIEDSISIDVEEEMIGIENNEEVYIKLSALGLTYRVTEEALNDESPFAFLLRFGLIHKIFGNHLALTDTYVFPPSRGPVLTEDVVPRTGLYEKFKFGLLKIDRYKAHPETVDAGLVELLKSVLGGNVGRKDGKYVYTVSNTELPISAAAASIREIAPIAMLIERTDISRIAMLIEEPEAHLHPLKQRMMADVVSLLCNGGAYMQITTHSDYFLRRLNELIGLRRIRMKFPDNYQHICQELRISPELDIHYDRVGAYLLKRNSDGTSTIEKQDIDDGVPFASFSEAIDESLKFRYRISEYLEGDESCRGI